MYAILADTEPEPFAPANLSTMYTAARHAALGDGAAAGAHSAASAKKSK